MIRTAQKAPKEVDFNQIAYEGRGVKRRKAVPVSEKSIQTSDKAKPCPRPANRRHDDFTVGECVTAGECGCGNAPEKRKRGPKPSGNAKTLLTLRIDQDTIAKFKATGPGWQTKMVEALKVAKV